MKKDIYIIGSGAQGQAALEVLREAAPENQYFFVDDNKQKQDSIINGCRVAFGIKELCLLPSPNVHLGIGDPVLRKKIAERLTECTPHYTSAIHPTAYLFPSSQVGKGVFIGASVIVSTNTKIGDFCILNNRVTVEHDSIIGDYCSMMPNTFVGGKVSMGDSCILGMSSFINARLSVGSKCIIDPCSIVKKDLLPSTYFSNENNHIVEANFSYAHLF